MRRLYNAEPQTKSRGAPERETIEGLREIVGYCSDPKAFTKLIKEEVRRLWEVNREPDPEVGQQLEEVEAKMGNVRKAIEEGLADTAWANARLQELSTERQRLSARATVAEPPPQISTEEAMGYRRQVEKIFSQGTMAERKRLLATWVRKVILAPDRREVEITYRVPEPVMNGVVAGALYVAIHNYLAPYLTRRIKIPVRGAARYSQDRTRLAQPPTARRKWPRTPRMSRTQEKRPQEAIPGALSSSGS